MEKNRTKLQVGEFEISISFYADNAVVIIHNSIPGIGNIIMTEKDNDIELQQLMGQENEMLNLLVMQLAKQFSTPTITFILSFHPSKFATFDQIKDFTKGFIEAAKSH
ncbi:hypothetical protein GPJ56_004776 [Histomonas meleagridis]|uniref:uncharacterized protein n=1 Tax=Histomonas meleagridis TaxID=135588 RepID=UPI00355AC402|nr:hypothetical protein GPJ56_004776 [Histomonas meleagridis]KAH0801674.1 hypothetical protein GO595_005509 [Histomonas meleagridis]